MKCLHAEYFVAVRTPTRTTKHILRLIATFDNSNHGGGNSDGDGNGNNKHRGHFYTCQTGNSPSIRSKLIIVFFCSLTLCISYVLIALPTYQTKEIFNRTMVNYGAAHFAFHWSYNHLVGLVLFCCFFFVLSQSHENFCEACRAIENMYNGRNL